MAVCKNQWKAMENQSTMNTFYENQWDIVQKTKETLGKPVETNENHWKLKGNQWKSQKSIET